MAHIPTQNKEKRGFLGDPVVQTSRSQCGGVGLMSGQGTKIPHVEWHSQKIIFKKDCKTPGERKDTTIHRTKSNNPLAVRKYANWKTAECHR